MDLDLTKFLVSMSYVKMNTLLVLKFFKPRLAYN